MGCCSTRREFEKQAERTKARSGLSSFNGRPPKLTFSSSTRNSIVQARNPKGILYRRRLILLLAPNTTVELGTSETNESSDGFGGPSAVLQAKVLQTGIFRHENTLARDHSNGKAIPGELAVDCEKDRRRDDCM